MTPIIPPCTQPTIYFIGVSTTQSSIMRVFPKWMAILGQPVQLVGYDAPLGAPADVYRAIVEHIKHAPLAYGALITAHKIDLLDAARDLFDDLETYAVLCNEVSCISKRAGRLEGRATDMVSAYLAWQGLVTPGYFARTGGQVLCLGGGGAAVAISVSVAEALDPADRPARFTLVDISAERLQNARAIHAQLKTDVQFDYILNADPQRNDELLAALPPGSVVINATGLGKDRPGSPISDHSVFPQNGLAWELNYRGALDFLRQARQQEQRRALTVADGWLYFLHGWTQVVTQVLQLELTPDLFARLDQAAAAVRG
jgi:shikimate 5-dehydrogenase